MLQLLIENPLVGIIVLTVIIISLTFHEAAHAFAAVRLGDDTPRYQGRLTLNPLAHLDPVGTALLVFAGFGWGKPVVINDFNFKNGRRDIMVVSFAGPLANLLIALAFAVLARLLETNLLVSIISQYVIYINVLLAVFNLLPIYPLDGSKVLTGLLPSNLAYHFSETQKYGIWVLLILLITNGLDIILNPLVSIVLRAITTLVGLPS